MKGAAGIPPVIGGKSTKPRRTNRGCFILLLLAACGLALIAISHGVAFSRTRESYDSIRVGMSLRQVFEVSRGWTFSFLEVATSPGKHISVHISRSVEQGFSIGVEGGRPLSLRTANELCEFLDQPQGLLVGIQKVRFFFDNPLGFGGTVFDVEFDLQGKVKGLSAIRIRQP